MKLLRAMIGFELPQWMAVELDGRVLAFTAILGVLCGIVSGLAPALHLSVNAVGRSLKVAAEARAESPSNGSVT